MRRIGDNVIVLRGRPRTAIFAHTDTTGFTLGYGRRLIPIGGPDPRDGDLLRCADGLTGRLRRTGRDEYELRKVRNADEEKVKPTPGTRWVYARSPWMENGVLTAPYLDDRAGVWAAAEALRRCENIAVAFCTGEEAHGHGARVCADVLYREDGITQALISDLTWHTQDTPCGSGVVISLRDAHAPRQAYLDRVLTLAAESGIPHQREIQSAGSSDGGHILRSSVPMDWVFVGAPEKKPHTSRERVTLTDLDAMRDLLAYLADRL
jgi:putative aminopeptidase FrvX